MGLDIVITNSPLRKPSDKENFDLGRQIGVDEWHNLFYSVLNVPELKVNEYESSADFLQRREKSFHEYLTNKGYEMLGRIWYIFRDSFYKPSEIDILLKECIDVQQKTQNTLALMALENLIYACNEAIRVKSGIWLISD